MERKKGASRVRKSNSSSAKKSTAEEKRSGQIEYKIITKGTPFTLKFN